MSCSAVYCSSRTTKEGVKVPELSFHIFPKCPEIRCEWIKAMRRDNWEPSKYSRLCSKHFEQSCYITGLSVKKLKSDAVPTIFEEYPVYYQTVMKKRKPPQDRSTSVNIQISPRKRKRMQEAGIDTDDMPTTPRPAIRALISALAQSRMTAARRLKTIKKLAEKNRRLMKKNASLTNVINDLKKKHLMDSESANFLSCIGSKCDDFIIVIA